MYRQWQFDNSLVKAVKVGNLVIAQLLEKHFEGCGIPGRVIDIAVVCGRTDMLKWLTGLDCDIEWHPEHVLEAIANELANWLLEKLPNTPVDYMEQISTKWAVAAADIGDLAMIKQICGRIMAIFKQICGGFKEETATEYAYKLDGGVNLWRAVQSAINSGHLHVLQWMVDEPNRKVFLYELLGLEFEKMFPVKIGLSLAVARGHTDVLAWLIQHFPENCNGVDADVKTGENEYLDILRLIISARIEDRTTPTLIAIAAGNGHLDIVKFLLAEGCPVNKAMDNAAESEFLDIVKWLHDNTSQCCSTAAMDGAASNGHLDIVKWLHHNREEGCTTNTMNEAAEQDHVLMVKWLHENRKEGCTSFAMDEAARAGNLEMVKWLHFNRWEDCTTSAMDSAAGNGHHDVVKWLHANRLEAAPRKRWIWQLETTISKC